MEILLKPLADGYPQIYVIHTLGAVTLRTRNATVVVPMKQVPALIAELQRALP